MGRWSRQFYRRHGLLTASQRRERSAILRHIHDLADKENNRAWLVRVWRSFVRRLKAWG